MKLIFLSFLLFGGCSLAMAATGGLFADCGMNILGRRGACMGSCILKNLNTVINGVMGSCMEEVLAFGWNVTCGEQDCTYNETYNRVLDDRTVLCKQIDDLYRCVGNVVHSPDVCGVFGSRFLKDAVTFVKSHLTCSAPKASNLLTCFANPDFVLSEGPRTCLSSFDPEFLSVLGSLNPNGTEGMQTFLTQLLEQMGNMCHLFNSTTSCVKLAAQNQVGFSKYCTDEIIGVFQGNIDALLNLVGCGENAEHDMLTCSIKLAEAEIRTNNITTNCGLESAFGALGAAVQDINGTMSLDLGEMCPLHNVLDCIGKEIKTVCGQKWSWAKFTELVTPVMDVINMEGNCTGTTVEVISNCGCYGNYPIAAKQPSTDSCSATTRGEMCAPLVWSAGVAMHAGTVSYLLSTLVSGLLLVQLI